MLGRKLFLACRDNELVTVREILANPELTAAHCQESYAEQLTALTVACLNNHYEIVRLLLDDSRVDVNYREPHMGGSSALHIIATLENTLDTAKLLVRHPRIDVNLEDDKGNTTLHYAYQFYYPELLSALLARSDLILDKKNKQKHTPFEMMLLNGNNHDAVKSFWYHPRFDRMLGLTNVNDTICGTHLLYIVALVDDFNYAKHLLQNPEIKINEGLPSEASMTPLAFACSKKVSMRLIELFLNHPQSKKESYNEALYVAACYGDLPLAKLLVQKGADINFKTNTGHSVLYAACRDGRLEFVQWLLSHDNLEVNSLSQGMSAFGVACLSQHLGIVKLLLKVPHLDPNHSGNFDHEGEIHKFSSPIFSAWNHGSVELVEILLEHDAIYFLQREEKYWNSLQHSLDPVQKLIAYFKAGFKRDRSLLRETQPLKILTKLTGLSENKFITSNDNIISFFSIEPIFDLADLLNTAKLETQRELKLRETFALIVLLCDECLQLKAFNNPIVRFFNIVIRLPLELQTIVCFRGVGSMQNTMNSGALTAGCRTILNLDIQLVMEACRKIYSALELICMPTDSEILYAKDLMALPDIMSRAKRISTQARTDFPTMTYAWELAQSHFEDTMPLEENEILIQEISTYGTMNITDDLNAEIKKKLGGSKP